MLSRDCRVRVSQLPAVIIFLPAQIIFFPSHIAHRRLLRLLWVGLSSRRSVRRAGLLVGWSLLILRRCWQRGQNQSDSQYNTLHGCPPSDKLFVTSLSFHCDPIVPLVRLANGANVTRCGRKELSSFAASVSV